MRKEMIRNKGIMLMISLSMLITLIPSSLKVHATEAKERLQNQDIGSIYEEPEHDRDVINFNRDWKFYLGDIENGQQRQFDDAAWTDVALPHSFDLPYNMSSSFYVGYGWYRKKFMITPDMIEKKVNLDFEGSFQVTELYVNGTYVGTHEGGYTGFTFDISEYLEIGDNEVAIRVNNIWQPDVSPRAGDHQFTGGIYRDVSMVVTDDVHVAWYGTFVTTPDLLNPAFDESAQNVLDSYTDEAEITENIKQKRSNVRVETEVMNDSNTAQDVQVKQEVVDKENTIIASFASDMKTLQAGEVQIFDALSDQIQNIELWGLENPYVYTVYTTVYKSGEIVDVFTSPLGFRSAQYKNDGLYINNEKTLIDGANVHQDHGGWGNAVTNEGFYRDVQMIKDCGMNFIRGSHYPHDPAFAKACDDIGMLFWSESVFWGMGGCNGQDDPATLSAKDWFKDAYPQNPADEEAFENSCKQSLTEMIRVNRNHPSIVNWSMGNEVFFTDAKTQAKAKALVNELRNLSHLLDPTRKAGMGGVQREGYDKIEVSDIAGYNGDGGKFTNLSMPNVVAEYGSKTADRPGELRPFYDQIQKPGDVFSYELKPNSAGLILWSGFHHGTIGGDGLAKMGMIDYYRLPLNSWYWYREKNLGIPAEQSKQGSASALQLTASQAVLHNDGSDDAQLIVTMLNEDGEWVNQSPNVTLTVVDGPGVFPTGKSYTFTSNNTMRDGKASIEFRSYYSGTTTIEAYTPGLPKTQIKLVTENVVQGDEGIEPDGFMVMDKQDTTSVISDPIAYGKNNIALKRPAFPSSNLEDAGLASDQNPNTQWVATKPGANEFWMLDAEFEQYFYKAKLDFKGNVYPYRIEISDNKDDGPWTCVASYDQETIKNRPYEESLHGVKGRYIKVTFTDVPENAYANLAEIAVYGNTASQSPGYVTDQAYISDLVPVKPITQGWVGMNPGIDQSIEGNPIRVGGITYDKGLGLHADSEAVYDLNGQYTRFQAIIGIDDETQGRGDAIYRVFATIDGQKEQLIYEKAVTGGQAETIDLSVNNVTTLRLVTDANGSNSSDHTNWANARVLGAVRDISKQASDYKVIYAGKQEMLIPGERYSTSLQMKNINNTSSAYSASLGLYNENGELIDITMDNGYILKGKSGSSELSIDIPDDFTGEARVNVFDTGSLKSYADTLHIAVPVEKTSQTQMNPGKFSLDHMDTRGEWVKLDGEDAKLVKVGNWAVWNAGEGSGAYKGTETYVEKNDWEGSSITLPFTGTQIKIGAKYDQSQKGADIYIDDVLVTTIHNQTTEAVNIYKEAWVSDVLPMGEHVLKIVPIGKFGLDYIEYTDDAETDTVDKTALISAIEKALLKVEAQYTPESWKPFQKALEEAVIIRDKDRATASEVNSALQSLNDAEESLKALIPVADMTSLRSAIQQVLDIVESNRIDTYEPDSVTAVSDALYNGYMIYVKQRVDQERVTKAADDIITAIEKLVSKDEDVNYCREILRGAIQKAIELKDAGMLEGVNKKVVALFDARLNEAIDVYASKEASNDALLTAWMNLANALQYLDFTANPAKLVELIASYKALDLSLYVDDDHMVEFKAAMLHAQSVLDDPSTLDQSLNSAYDRLISAKSNLILKENVLDTFILDYLIQKSKAIQDHSELYDTADDSWNLFIKAYQNACQAREKLESQKALDDAAQVLASAYENIRLIADEDMLQQLRSYIAEIKELDLTNYPRATIVFFMNTKALLQDMLNQTSFTMKQYLDAERLMAEVRIRIQDDKQLKQDIQNPVEIDKAQDDVVNSNNEKTILNESRPATGDAQHMGWMLGMMGVTSSILYTIRKKKKAMHK